jgi:hypothetical protein
VPWGDGLGEGGLVRLEGTEELKNVRFQIGRGDAVWKRLYNGKVLQYFDME